MKNILIGSTIFISIILYGNYIAEFFMECKKDAMIEDEEEEIIKDEETITLNKDEYYRLLNGFKQSLIKIQKELESLKNTTCV